MTSGATISVDLTRRGTIATTKVKMSVGQEGTDGGMTVKTVRVTVTGTLGDTDTETMRIIITAPDDGGNARGNAHDRVVAHQGMNENESATVIVAIEETDTRTIQSPDPDPAPARGRSHALRGPVVGDTGMKTMMTTAALASVAEHRHARRLRATNATDLQSSKTIPRDRRHVRRPQLLEKTNTRATSQIHWRTSSDHSPLQKTARIRPQSVPEGEEPTSLARATSTHTSPPVTTLPSTSTRRTTTTRQPPRNPRVVQSLAS